MSPFYLTMDTTLEWEHTGKGFPRPAPGRSQSTAHMPICRPLYIALLAVDLLEESSSRLVKKCLAGVSIS